jgi:hypothetical protein
LKPEIEASDPEFSSAFTSASACPPPFWLEAADGLELSDVVLSLEETSSESESEESFDFRGFVFTVRDALPKSELGLAEDADVAFRSRFTREDTFGIMARTWLTRTKAKQPTTPSSNLLTVQSYTCHRSLCLISHTNPG